MSRQHPIHPDDDRGEYELDSESRQGSKRRPPVHVHVYPLEYERRTLPTRKGIAYWQISPAVHFILGLLSVFACLPLFTNYYFISFAWLLVLGINAIVRFSRDDADWSGFFPGVICGVLILPIAGFILCAVSIG